MTLPAAWTIAYKYDAAGRPNKVTTPWNETVSFTYDVAGRPTNKDARNGTADTSPVIYQATHGYNAINQLTGHYYANAGGQLIASFGGIIYDGVGNMTAADHHSALAYPGFDGRTTYVYSGTSDGRITGRLLQESSVRHAAGGAGFTSNFLYDATGNVTQRNSGMRPDQNFSGRSYNSANQPNDGVSTFNGNGDQTKTLIFSSLSYDLEGRATQFEYFGNVFRCGYYDDGRRAFTTNHDFIYDGNDPVLETDKAGNITAVNVFGPDGLLSRRTGSGSRFYLFDERGNTAMRVNASGTPLSAGITDAFGFTGYVYSTTTGNEYDPYSGFGAQWGYYFDPETTQTLCGLRYYDPFQARWLTRDPIGQSGGVNLYAYVSGNPIMGIDPFGMGGPFGWFQPGATGFGHVWGGINSLFGAIGGIGGTWRYDRKHEVYRVNGGWLAWTNEKLGFGGITLGDIVIANYDIGGKRYEHECVHATQSRILGPAYVPLTILGYGAGGILQARAWTEVPVRWPLNMGTLHDASPFEVWADSGAGLLHRNNSATGAYLQAWLLSGR